MRGCPPAPGHREVLVPGQWELKEAEKRRREVRCVVIIVHYCDGLVIDILHYCDGLVVIILHYCGGLVFVVILPYYDGLVVMDTCVPPHTFCAYPQRND